ncbi:/ / hypothetical protein / 410470:411981 Reverse [Candidatus Hepatoplasma crinochetorum]|uniref:Uncharacterized protein n=1 Tax=Candidatus Hepatoplasma crinochetorum TaxID=295596 RepID=A0A0G7ZMW5_9MOLU|nr:/ / hypothetical protein / 410470:411981 Reverse [Candidatus Hepatoplasma crinochetorum]
MKFKEFTLKIKYFFSSGLGKILISFFLIISILLVILLPIFFTNSSKVKSIYVFGFDANITGTGTNFDNYIGVEKDYQYWNHDIVWAQNQEQMLNGIEQSSNSIGYLGKSVSEFDLYDPINNPNGELKALELYTNDINLNNSNSYEPGYVDYNSDAYPMLSSLNIWFRVPASVAPIINKNIMFSNTTGIDIDQTIWGTDWIIGSEARTLTEEQEEYFQDYVILPNYLKYFVFSFIFFNWVAFSEQAQLITDDIAKSYQPDDFNQDYLLSDQEFEQYLANFANNLESINADWTIDNFVDNNSSDSKNLSLILTLEGSGTVQPTLDALSRGRGDYLGFSDYLTIWLQDYYNDQTYSFDFTLTLNSHDSGQAFAISNNGASPNSFLGTQSRGYDIDDVTRKEQVNLNETLTWGYDTITEDDLDQNGFYYLPDTETDQNLTQPVYYTLATDPILILTGKNTSFKIDSNTYHPKGITPEGLKYIYSFDGKSWEWLYKAEALIETEED